MYYAQGLRRALAVLAFGFLTSAYATAMKNPAIKHNPTPKKRYDITLTVDGAPGPFDSITGFVEYKVTNDECVPLEPVSGATIAPEEKVPVVFKHEAGNVYIGAIYADLMQDEDYYGLGICHWQVVAASAVLKNNAVEFSPAIFHKDIEAQHTVPTYFVKGDYTDNTKPHSAFGTTNRSLFQPESRTDVFTVTLAAKEDFQ
ncbi:hypothetical protein [Dyella sp. GSA-30]|uniref:hypothetical protein n=1 Tax=Dyella sp. GSA-30 TaxID=2994496 RepID=UPI0024939E8D|nr:hypothetical protein [Dyella sp. GSA-30]BDU18549.1 hypothetical protein DYGSA30_00060 [Dyella sp. GSA-30]